MTAVLPGKQVLRYDKLVTLSSDVVPQSAIGGTGATPSDQAPYNVS